MIRRLKEYFIPHEGNDHQPHFLRSKQAFVAIVIVLLLELGYLAHVFLIFPKSDFFAAVLVSVLVDQTNERRGEDKLPVLKMNAKLAAAAKLKADDMAARSYFAHNTPDGRTPWWFVDKAGYVYDAAGENLAVNFTDSTDITNAWMHSPTHRANIMNGNFSEIGIATADGMYKGRNAIFVVQMFGRPTRSIMSLETATPVGLAAVPRMNGATKPAKVEPVGFGSPIKQAVERTDTTDVSTATLAIRTADASVAGAQVAREDAQFIEVSPISPPVQANTATAWQKFIASPRVVTNVICMILGAIVLLALTLAVFIKIRIQYPRIIANGFLLAAFIGGVILLNTLLATTIGSV